MIQRSHLFVLLPLAFWLLAACGEAPSSGEYVARVGNEYLTQEELGAALATLPIGFDSTDAKQQFIEHWVTNVLLAQEAERRGLKRLPEVQRLLRENERSVLITALVNSFYEEETEDPSASQIRSYFETNKDHLRLREPFVRIRYLRSETRESAETARRALQEAVSSGTVDSLWPWIISEYSSAPEISHDFLHNYFPEGGIVRSMPSLGATLTTLRTGQISPVVHADQGFHFVQVIDRVPAGSVPMLEWVEGELRERLKIRLRKQMYTRQVQRLRNEALAREHLEIN